jgi:sugar lactone lactonase YvrE
MFSSAVSGVVRLLSASTHISSRVAGKKAWGLSAVAALGALVVAGMPLQAQTAHFSGAVQTLGSGFSSPSGVAVDGSGNVFVADAGHNAVKEIVAAGGYTTVNTLGSGFNDPEGLAVDGNGNVFVADHGNNAVKEILSAGGYTTVNILGSGFSYPNDVAVDGSENVFVVSGCNCVNEILAAGGYSTVNTLGLSGAFAGVAVDNSGNVFVVDYLNSSLKEIMAAGGYSTVNPLDGGSGPYAVAVDGNENVFVVAYVPSTAVRESVAAGGYTIFKGLGGGFSYPSGVAVDGSGNIFVADTHNNAVKEIQTARGNFGSVNVGNSSTAPLVFYFHFDSAGTLGSTAVLTQGAAGLDFTDVGGGSCTAGQTYSSGNVCTVRVTFTPKRPGPRYGAVELLDTSGNLLAMGYVQGSGVGPQATFANTTSGVYLPSSQIALGGGFNYPIGVAVDGSGNIFVVDYNNNDVKEIVAAGGYTIVRTLASGFYGLTGVTVDGAGNVFFADYYAVNEIVAAGGYTTINTLGSGFVGPDGVAVDGSGNVFVADTGHGALKEILAAGGYNTVSTLASGFGYLYGVAVDGSGNVFVVDYNAVKEILAAGGYTTVNTLSSAFSRAFGLAVDGGGNVFVADTNGGAVRELVAAGGYTTVNTLGSGFNFPSDVAVDGSGNVFVAGSHNVISKLDFANPPSLSFAQAPVGSQSSDSPQTVTVLNDGNADLTFPFPASGNNPSIASGFTLGASTTCPELSASSAAGMVAAGTSCTYAVNFIPVAEGTDSGSMVLTDNSLNASPGTTQTIPLSGSTPITPTLTWATPAPIIFGTALSATQLDATSTVAGTYTYSPPSGTVPAAGTPTLSVTLNPTDTTHYLSATKTVLLTVNKAKPVITWAAPAAITYGTALSATQLNATASVPGVLVYSPAAGAVPPAGTRTLSVTFTPTDSANYATRTVSVTLTVNKVVLTVKANNASQTYGAASPTFTDTITGFIPGQGLGALSGTASLTTAATATSPVGTYPIVAAQGTLVAANYTFQFVNGTLTVNKATPGLTWATPAAITYGTALSSTQLDATANVAGTFLYSPAAGATPAAGTHTMWVTFTPTDTTDYASKVVSVTLTVNKKVLTVTAKNASRAFGAANPTFTDTFTGFVLGQTKSVLTGAASLTTTATSISHPGAYPIVAAQGTLAAVNYTLTFVNGTLTVNKAVPVITWAAPAPITYGTALSSTQLDATAGIPGTFVYTPAAGAMPSAGTHTLWVTFTPTDTADYASKAVSTTLTVNKKVLTVTANNASRAFGAANPTFIDTIAGFVAGQGPGVLTGAVSLTTAATAASPVGTYAIVAAQGTLAAANYTFTFVNGTLTVR